MSLPDFCFVHAADLHLGSPFSGIIAGSELAAQRLVSASNRALDALVRLCNERRAAFLVLAGDVFDSTSVDVRTQYQLYSALSSLAHEGIPSFVSWGNHDPLGSWRATFNWPPEVHFFGADVGWHEVRSSGRTIAVVGGVSYARPEVNDNLSLKFRRPPHPHGDHDPDRCLCVGVLHCNVGVVPEHGNYAPCSLNDLAAAGIDYWALGHVHRHKVLAGPGEGVAGASSFAAVYPGATQGRDITETGAHGCCVVHVSGGRVADIEFVPTDDLRWLNLTIDTGAMRGLDEIVSTVAASCSAECAQSGLDAVAVRVRLFGRGGLHRELSRQGAGQVERWLRESLEHEGRAAGRWWWLESVQDATAPDIDRAALKRSGGLVAELIEAANRLSESAADLESLVRSIEQELGPPRARAALASLSVDEVRDIVAEAETYALDLLLAGEGEAGGGESA